MPAGQLSPSFYETVAQRVIGTILQRPAELVRSLRYLPKRIRHPELREIYLEKRRTEQMLCNEVYDGANCLDIGAHLGAVVDDFCRLSPSGKHIAFEPLAYKAGWLREKYPHVKVEELALSDSNGSVDFVFYPKQSGFSGLGRHMGDQDSMTCQVRCARLDDVVPADHQVDFIKIDVEGAEYSAFRGAPRVLTENNPVILFECTRSGLGLFNYGPDDVHKLLCDEYGYRIFLIKDWLDKKGGLSREQFAKATEYPFRAFNFIAAKRR